MQLKWLLTTLLNGCLTQKDQKNTLQPSLFQVIFDCILFDLFNSFDKNKISVIVTKSLVGLSLEKS